MALAERHLAARYSHPGFAVVDHRTWVIASDGDLMEGISHEAGSLAGRLRLGRRVVLYDDNRITIEGPTDLAFSEDVEGRFAAYEWRTLRVEDGNDLEEIAAALDDAASREREWVFSLPKMLRPYFLYHRPLLGCLCRAAYETVRELMAEAVAAPGLQPGMIAVVQTFGGALTWNPHVHALVTRGGWDREGSWAPIPYVDQTAAAELLRYKVFPDRHLTTTLTPPLSSAIVVSVRKEIPIHSIIEKRPGTWTGR